MAQKPMTISEMFKQAMKVPSKDRIFTSTILLLLLIPYSILLVATQLVFLPTLHDLTDNIARLATDPPQDRELLLESIKAEAKSIMLFKLANQAILLLISMLTVTAMSGAAVAYYQGGEFGLSRWFAKLKASWKGFVSTYLYVKLLGLGYIAALSAFVAMLVFMFGLSTWSLLLWVIVAVLGLLLLLHLNFIWSMGLVAAGTEDCGGLVALGIGARVTGGRRKQGFALALVMMSVSFVVAAVYSSPKEAVLVAGVASGDLIELWNVIVWTVFGIYYSDCKATGVAGDVEGAEGFEYKKIDCSEV